MRSLARCSLVLCAWRSWFGGWLFARFGGLAWWLFFSTLRAVGRAGVGSLFWVWCFALGVWGGGSLLGSVLRSGVAVLILFYFAFFSVSALFLCFYSFFYIFSTYNLKSPHLRAFLGAKSLSLVNYALCVIYYSIFLLMFRPGLVSVCSIPFFSFPPCGCLLAVQPVPVSALQRNISKKIKLFCRCSVALLLCLPASFCFPAACPRPCRLPVAVPASHTPAAILFFLCRCSVPSLARRPLRLALLPPCFGWGGLAGGWAVRVRRRSSCVLWLLRSELRAWRSWFGGDGQRAFLSPPKGAGGGRRRLLLWRQELLLLLCCFSFCKLISKCINHCNSFRRMV